MIKIIEQLSESECEELAYRGRSQTRFFYNADMKDESFKRALKDVIQRNGLFNQSAANRQAQQILGIHGNAKERRAAALDIYNQYGLEQLQGDERGNGYRLDNSVYNELFQTTYRKSGHFYLYGVRIY